MEVTLLDHNPNALELLLYTKNTRLQGQQSLTDIILWPLEKKMEELAYMKDTIKSSWEFSNYTFEIKGVTRAFTHQLVRTRHGSYAQQAQRVVDVREMGWETPDCGAETKMFDAYMKEAIDNYANLVDNGVANQDARGVIPTNIHTNIIMGANLRTLHQMAEIRLCYKTQGEYQNVFRKMRECVIEVHPWAEDFLQVFCANHGTCAFPRFTECPVYPFTYHGKPKPGKHAEVLTRIKVKHSDTVYEADPGIRGKA